MTFAAWTNSLVGVINTVVVPMILALTFLTFLWGIVNYFFLNGDNEEKRSEGKQFIFWGILGMVVLFGVWGLVRLLVVTLGFAQ